MAIQDKRTDAKGRVAIAGLENARVEIEQLNEFEYIVRRVEVIPAREAWLYKNPEALASLRRGLQDAQEGRFARDPMLDDEEAEYVSNLTGAKKT